MPPMGFEPAISAHEGPLTHALDRAASGTDRIHKRDNTRERERGGGVISRSNRTLNDHSICTRHVLGV